MYPILAELVLVSHVAFVAFALLGALFVLRWPRLAWLHAPAVAWGAFVELDGRICPLTHVENALRAAAGEAAAAPAFLDRVLTPLLYPSALSRDVQIALGVGLLLVNAGLYGLVLARSRRRAQAHD